MSNKNQRQYHNHPNNPGAQPFHGHGNKTTKNGWWRKGKTQANKASSE